MVGHRLAGDQAASAESGRDAALENREQFAPAAASTFGARNTASIPGLSGRNFRPAPIVLLAITSILSIGGSATHLAPAEPGSQVEDLSGRAGRLVS